MLRKISPMEPYRPSPCAVLLIQPKNTLALRNNFPVVRGYLCSWRWLSSGTCRSQQTMPKQSSVPWRPYRVFCRLPQGTMERWNQLTTHFLVSPLRFTFFSTPASWDPHTNVSNSLPRWGFCLRRKKSSLH